MLRRLFNKDFFATAFGILIGTVVWNILDLTACATTPANVQSGIQVACNFVAAANAGFQVVAATGKLSAADIEYEKIAYAGVETVCANPAAITDISTAVSKIMQTAGEITGLLNDSHVQAAVVAAATKTTQ